MVALSALASLAAYLVAVSAHGGVIGLQVGSTSYAGWQPYNAAAGQTTAERPYASFDPITNPTAATLHCNDDGNSGPNQQSITIAAGDTLIGKYSQWTHAEGPYTVYMAACPGSSCTGFNSAQAKWFKISEMGLISGTLAAGQWANGLLMKNLQWPATIPSCLKPGPYLVRFETLALHQANAPQFYPECVQVIVTGSGSTVPSSTVSIPGAWSANDPGVMVDIYSDAAKTITTYTPPGPRPFTCGGTQPPPVSSQTPPKSSSSPVRASSTTVKPSTTSTGGGASQTAYGQCGGQGWTGPTACVSPYKCTVSNQYYSQCLP